VGIERLQTWQEAALLDKGVIKRSALRRRIRKHAPIQVSDEYIDMLEELVWETVKQHIHEAERRGDRRLQAKHVDFGDGELDVFA